MEVYLVYHPLQGGPLPIINKVITAGKTGLKTPMNEVITLRLTGFWAHLEKDFYLDIYRNIGLNINFHPSNMADIFRLFPYKLTNCP